MSETEVKPRVASKRHLTVLMTDDDNNKRVRKDSTESSSSPEIELKPIIELPFAPKSVDVEKVAPTVVSPSPSPFTAIKPKQLDLEKWHRFIVTKVDRTLNRIELTLRNAANDLSYSSYLTGQWFYTNVSVKDVINMRISRVKEGILWVENGSGLIVVNPDQLVSCTTVATSLYCSRKAWLSNKFGGWGSGNKAMMVGTIVHELFQEACDKKFTSEAQLLTYFDTKRKDTDILHNLYANNMTDREMAEEVKQYIPQVIKWVNLYIHHGPSPCHDQPEKRVQVVKVHDIEDNIWSVNYGLKGKVDVTLEVEIHERNKPKATATVPLELKTGKHSFSPEHQGQVSLYSVMMDKRQYGPCDTGFLAYLKDGPQMKHVTVRNGSKQGLIQSRNEVAFYSTSLEKGPQIKENTRFCGNCDHLLDCALMLKGFEEEKLEASKEFALNLVPSVTSHLDEKHEDFFVKWVNLLNLESNSEQIKSPKPEAHFWNKTSQECEKSGIALAKVIVTGRKELVYSFQRSRRHVDCLGALSSSSFKVGERVVLSLDRDETEEGPGKSEPMVAFNSGAIESSEDGVVCVQLNRLVHESLLGATFRLDQYPNSFWGSTNFTNILRLMSPEQQRLRSLIIDRKPPEFGSEFSSQIVKKGKSILRALNETQQRAVLKALSAKDYVLLRGMPGAGKTQTIVAIVRLLVALNKSVLVTCYTHSALDNILLKLKVHEIPFLRMGPSHRIHAELQEYSCQRLTGAIDSVEDLCAFYSKQQVVASTCLGVASHSLFEMRTFDYCIMDEASQVLLPTALGPLFTSQKFALVGDPQQLPAIVKSEAAVSMGMNQSLFALLQNETNTVNLTIQYRMNKEIMSLANQFTYKNMLVCGSEAVANGALAGEEVRSKEEWLQKALSFNLENSVAFINTDAIQAKEIKDATGLVHNRVEADLVVKIVSELINSVKAVPSQVGIITPYQRQVRHLKEVLQEDGIEVNTVDQYQGRDKDVIIISCVRSNAYDEPIVGQILNDERRLNVAFTRAKKKLIIVGSKCTLSNYGPFQKLFAILRSDQYIHVGLQIES